MRRTNCCIWAWAARWSSQNPGAAAAASILAMVCSLAGRSKTLHDGIDPLDQGFQILLQLLHYVFLSCFLRILLLAWVWPRGIFHYCISRAIAYWAPAVEAEGRGRCGLRGPGRLT